MKKKMTEIQIKRGRGHKDPELEKWLHDNGWVYKGGRNYENTESKFVTNRDHLKYHYHQYKLHPNRKQTPIISKRKYSTPNNSMKNKNIHQIAEEFGALSMRLWNMKADGKSLRDQLPTIDERARLEQEAITWIKEKKSLANNEQITGTL